MTLIEQIQNDRYGDEYQNQEYALGWNDCSQHIERLIKRIAREQGLAELRDACLMDLRVKTAMTGLLDDDGQDAAGEVGR